MGISDDIKPKKSYRYSSRTKRQDDLKESMKEGDSVDVEKTTLDDKEDLEDDFFQRHASDRFDDEKPVPRRQHTGAGKIILILMVVVLIVVVCYQNFDSVTNLLDKNFNLFTQDNSNTYTSNTYDNKNSSQNRNVNLNSNTNTSLLNDNLNANSTPAIDKSLIKIEVLNGNGVTGSAEKLKSVLTNVGYTVSKVANARRFTYPDTIIYHKTGDETTAQDIKAVLTGYQTLIENSDSIAGTYDIVIVVGKQ